MNTFHNVALASIFIIVILISGCASISSFKTAKPLGKGNVETMLSA